MHKLTPTLELLILILAGCSTNTHHGNRAHKAELRLAVTTSTRDSGLLDVLVPVFEGVHDAHLIVIAAGTGAALELGAAEDVDVVLVHSRSAEDAFIADGHGVRREDVMYNTFEILGPVDDPARVRNMEPAAALKQIAVSGQRFVSRGDNSGTHMREKKLWHDANELPQWDGYVESGQGMGTTLTMADQVTAYVLCDRGTYLKLKQNVSLVPLVSSWESLRNPYGVMVVNPQKHANINNQLAQAFVNFVISAEAQRLIRDYKIAGESLFYPLRLPDEK